MNTHDQHVLDMQRGQAKNLLLTMVELYKIHGAIFEVKKIESALKAINELNTRI